MVTCADALEEAVRHYGGEATSRQIFDYINENYPSKPWKDNTIQTHIIGCTVNHSSSHHYKYFRKFLYHLGPGHVRLYDPEKDSKWIWTKDGMVKVDPEDEIEINGDQLFSEVQNWICVNKKHFYDDKCNPIHDEENLERIKRFADSPCEYLKERLELNKDVSKNYHKLHHSMLLAGTSGFYLLIVSSFVKYLLDKYGASTLLSFRFSFWSIPIIEGLVIAGLILGPIIAVKIRLTTKLLSWLGLLRVIRDSEIEVYYISKILEARKNAKNESCK